MEQRGPWESQTHSFGKVCLSDSMERYAGRVAVVTGASSGIGRAVAEALVRQSMQVVGAARRIQRVQDLAQSLSIDKSCKGQLHAVSSDVSREDEVQRLYEWTETHLGGVSVVVNCAGTAMHQPTQDLEAGSITQMINTNVGGVICSCKEAINSMQRHGIKDGHIININSVGGHYVPSIPGISFSVYSGTKFAITAFCRGLRADVKRLEGFKIKVTSISPGSVDTEMMDDPLWSELAKDAPADSMLDPTDIVDAVTYALSRAPHVEVVELTVQPTNETC